jgi:ribosomal protein L37AE/L43A
MVISQKVEGTIVGEGVTFSISLVKKLSALLRWLKMAQCEGCKEIIAKIDRGAEGIWNCKICGKEFEWGT